MKTQLKRDMKTYQLINMVAYLIRKQKHLLKNTNIKAGRMSINMKTNNNHTIIHSISTGTSKTIRRLYLDRSSSAVTILIGRPP